MYKRFVFFRPKKIYLMKLLSPAPTSSNPLACTEVDVISYTNGRKARAACKVQNRALRAVGSKDHCIITEVRVL